MRLNGKDKWLVMRHITALPHVLAEDEEEQIIRCMRTAIGYMGNRVRVFMVFMGK